MRKPTVLQALGALVAEVAGAAGVPDPQVRVSGPRRRAEWLGPVGQRGHALSPAERRAIFLGLARPTKGARARPGRLFKGHRP